MSTDIKWHTQPICFGLSYYIPVCPGRLVSVYFRSSLFFSSLKVVQNWFSIYTLGVMDFIEQYEWTLPLQNFFEQKQFKLNYQIMLLLYLK